MTGGRVSGHREPKMHRQSAVTVSVTRREQLSASDDSWPGPDPGQPWLPPQWAPDPGPAELRVMLATPGPSERRFFGRIRAAFRVGYCLPSRG